MVSTVPIKEQIVIEKSAVITFEDVVDEMAFRRYLKNNWENLTLGLKNSTILFLAGVHGDDSGKLGPNEDIQTLKNQVIIIPNESQSRYILTFSFIVVQTRNSEC